MRYGKTPQWGVYNKRDGIVNPNVILDTYNYSVEVKDYEQLDATGRVAGYLIYEQVVNFDMSGTLLYGCGESQETSCGYAWKNPGAEYSKIGKIDLAASPIYSYLGGVDFKFSHDSTTPTTAIIKNYSVNTSQGAAATFSLSGTIYSFSNDSSN